MNGTVLLERFPGSEAIAEISKALSRPYAIGTAHMFYRGQDVVSFCKMWFDLIISAIYSEILIIMAPSSFVWCNHPQIT